MRLRSLLLSTAIAVAATPAGAWACSVARIFGAEELVRRADVIVLARATAYALDPGPPGRRGDRNIEFDVLEVLRGPDRLPTVAVSGQLVDTDDFNDRAAPYQFVRPGGRRGNCFATTYRTGGQFLLFLFKGTDGYTTFWAPLAAVNEQVHSERDPWVTWVRSRVAFADRAVKRD